LVNFCNQDTNSNGTTDSVDDYDYDANGNMIKDDNKNITKIIYNHLNLPIEITFGTTGKINYLYDATGQKVKKTVTNGTTITTTDYLNGYQYVNAKLQFFGHAEGYVNVQYPTGLKGDGDYATYSYVFNYIDHLGNVRVSYAKNATTNKALMLEENNYYAFGLKHRNYNVDVFRPVCTGCKGDVGIPGEPINAYVNPYKYKYNGKELQDELGLNLYDYGARNYDPALGRWMNIDPLAEVFSTLSPYNYVNNNPVFFVDPDGMRIRNGDEQRKKDIDEQTKNKKEYRDIKLNEKGLKTTSSRKELKNTLTKEEFKGLKKINKEIEKLEKDSRNLDSSIKETNNKITELATEAPLLFKAMDELDIDIFMGSRDNLSNGHNDGQNNTQFDTSDPLNIRLKSCFGECSTEILIVNNPSDNRTTLDVSKHEFGHAWYIINNTTEYYNWLIQNNLLNNRHDGHLNGDKSGIQAHQFGLQKFKN
jgi:RHS repeat-associated protein